MVRWHRGFANPHEAAFSQRAGATSRSVGRSWPDLRAPPTVLDVEGGALLIRFHVDQTVRRSVQTKESKMSPTSEASEYGVPRTTITSKYSWLGADKSPTELPTGIINMGARTYIPQLGRFEQTDPQPGGSVNSYAYTDDDPVNEADPSGEWTTTTSYNSEAASQGAAAAGISESYIGGSVR
jgi:RHS repeat-associated protein